MKVIQSLLLLSISVCGLSACKTTIDPKNEKVIIQNQGSDFCPPGQAKKGNC
ncbi:MAG: hypothetical protein H6855_01390 [Rhodospirillales bacterium]|nr:hypothetical protein [Rhodospirillales bacterium]MCB9964724.1 hypothetical protein [Rhodospirillales bacterium]MCB9980628.1 hypothetical protein [Rhodospirillales bacterium]